MRTWSLDDRGRVCVDGSPFWWINESRQEVAATAQFIVDACNARERYLSIDDELAKMKPSIGTSSMDLA